MTVLLGLFGGFLAAAGVWSLFLDWLNLLGMLVPPIGALIILTTEPENIARVLNTLFEPGQSVSAVLAAA